MAYVYMLSTYGEYGAENAMATLDRASLLELIDLGWPYKPYEPPDGVWTELARREAQDGQAHHAQWIAEAKRALEGQLEKPDTELCATRAGHDLHDGWGGMQLHVIELR